MDLQVPQMTGIFLTILATISFSKMILLHEVGYRNVTAILCGSIKGIVDSSATL
jgi:hypothetical protein